MFILDGRTLPPDSPFTHNGVHYPANWLRLSTLEEKQAIGIKEVPDPPSYDQRFYWGYDKSGNLIPKDHDQLVAQWKSQTQTTAGTLLAPTDWMIVRQVDNGTEISTNLKVWRQSIRSACGTKLDAIEKTKDTYELASYITGSEYSQWPSQDDKPTPAFAAATTVAGASGIDVISFGGGASGDSIMDSLRFTI